MLVAIYTNFSPLISLGERVEITGEAIEVFDEIFFSVGEQDKGFSLSLAQDYASIGRINDIRTQTFGGRGLLEDEYPNMVVFPFEISKVYRFFDFKWIKLPNLKSLGFEILSFLHIQFDPRNSPDIEKDEAAMLMGDSTVFMASRMFEAVIISVYSNYDDYNKDTTRIMQTLKENKWIAENPMIRTYSLHEMIFIKDFKFAPITRKVLGCDFLI